MLQNLYLDEQIGQKNNGESPKTDTNVLAFNLWQSCPFVRVGQSLSFVTLMRKWVLLQKNTLHLYFTPHGKNSFQWFIDLIVKDKMINIQYKKKHSYKICKHTYTRTHRLHYPKNKILLSLTTLKLKKFFLWKDNKKNWQSKSQNRKWLMQIL